MSIETSIKSRVDLDTGVQKTALRMLFAAGDGDAHKIEIAVTRGGSQVDLSGASVTGSFIRARDNATVLLTGSVSGNSALISLSPACYNASGAFSVAVRLTLDGQKHTIFYGTGSIARTSTDTIIDDENIIPSLNDLLAQIDRMESGTQAANAAAASANSAASAANAAAQNANTKADVANQAASNANTQASAAQAAAQKIDGMTVSATGLPAGSKPTAAISDVDGHKHVAFGIPKGNKGDTGATPDISIGTVTTGAPGTDASATMTGTPEAPVLSLTIPSGMPGEGNVSSVAGVMPDEDGDVPLSAADVGAYPDGGIRSLTFSIAVSAWAGAGPYTYTITDSGVTANTWCEFELTSAVHALLTADIAWTTSAGQIALSTQAKPAGTLSGTILLMEVS